MSAQQQQQQQQRTLGTTAPISTAEPTAGEQRQTAALRGALEREDPADGPEESRRREEVLGKLSQICNEWSRAAALRKGAPEDAGARIYTFGSYRLGVSGRGADIDTLCVGPGHLDRREDFFGALPDFLRRCPDVSSITLVPDAYTPVIKLVFAGIEMDLLFACLSGHTRLPESLSLLDDSLLQNLDMESVRSLNGPRVVEDILRLVPNVDVFKLTLRAVKVWAKRKHIYANKIGYLGGISWAILVARTCQLYPNACASTVLAKFFKLMTMWKWPSPILLCDIAPEKGHKVWNPRQYPRDAENLMPVITPTYPSMNSTYNVSRSTLALMTDEFVHGAQTVALVDKGAAQWSALFAPSNFFARYKLFVLVELAAASQDDFNSWEGYTQSRMRKLVEYLEQCQGVLYAQPLIDAFEWTPSLEATPVAGVVARSFFIGLKFDTKAPRLDLTSAVVQFTGEITQPTPSFVKKASMEIRITPRQLRDIPQAISGIAPKGASPAAAKRSPAASSPSEPAAKRAKGPGTPASPTVAPARAPSSPSVLPSAPQGQQGQQQAQMLKNPAGPSQQVAVAAAAGPPAAASQQMH
eukprot:m51a1_g10008 hypothetical protein (583) ;mRNA; f:2729-5905